MNKNYTDVGIIGAGPSGMAAALQLRRYGIKFLLFGNDKELLRNAWQVENYLGFTENKSGVELLQSFRQHLQQHDIESITEEVNNINYEPEKSLFVIKTSKSVYCVRILVVASGTKPNNGSPMKKVPISLRHNVFYEVFPLLKKRNKIIAIIGAGDAAFDFALNLAERNKVFIINRQNSIKALPALVNLATQNSNITYKENCSLRKITRGNKKMLSLTFANEQDVFALQADYLIAAIGRVPQKDFYSKNLLTDEEKLISNGILYLVGDVQGHVYRQVSIATASGIKAAMQICERLRDK
jgi:thioredoxin reductase (NADPH)